MLDSVSVGWLVVAGVLIAASGAIVAPRVPPSWFISAAVVLSVFSGHWDQFGLPIGPDRLLFAAGIGVAVLRLVVDRGRDVELGSARVMAILAISAYALISAIADGNIGDREAFFALLDKLGLFPFLVFVLAPTIFRTELDRRIFLGSLVGLATYLGLVGLFEVVGPRSFVLPSYITNPAIGIHPDRARGPFVESAGFGNALFVCVIATAMWAFGMRRSASARTFGVVVIALCLIGIVGTVTRGAWLSAIVASTAMLLSVRPLRRFFVPLAAGVAGLVGIVLVATPGLLARATNRAEAERPLWDRYNSNRAAWNMFKESPLFGHGWGSFRDSGLNYVQIVDDYPLTFVRQVHNVLLSNLAELGLLGAGLWVVALAIAISPIFWYRSPLASSVWRIGLIGVAVSYIVTSQFIPLGYAFPNALLWTWAGITWTAMVPAPARSPAPVPSLLSLLRQRLRLSSLPSPRRQVGA